MNDTLKFFKYQNMLPTLSIDPFHPASSLTEIFNARQLYISDISINQEFIRFIRNINEKEEQKYKNRFSENVTIDKTLFKQRFDQYDYKEFCSLAIKEKLIEEKKIKYNNKPIISIILPTYNKKNILLKSVRSIQNQKYKNIEIIIVDDCSNDNSTYLFNYHILFNRKNIYLKLIQE